MKNLGLLLFLLLMANTALADALPQNTKTVKHQVQIDNLKNQPGFVFFLRPGYATKSAKATEVTANPTDIPGTRIPELRLFAVPKNLYDLANGKAQDDWFDQQKSPTVLQSVERLPARTTAKRTNPTTRIVTHVEVTIKDNQLSVKEVAVKRYDKNDQEVMPGGGGAPDTTDATMEQSTMEQRRWYYLGIPALASGLLGLTLYIRRKKPA